jgi:hypothetical protein
MCSVFSFSFIEASYFYLALTGLALVLSNASHYLQTAGACGCYATFVRRVLLPYGLPEKAQSGLLVATGDEQKVDGLTAPVNGTVRVCPLALDLDIRFIHAPTRADRTLVAFPLSSIAIKTSRFL